ncbi:MAG: hypothetical protein JWO36_1195 [Myxococcales bacterium]|nr:hypothetical protein [Myxococcales bacterium]
MTKLVILASLLGMSTLAHADTSLSATQPAEPKTYIQGGLVAGGIYEAALYGAVELDAGRRLGHGPLWVHAMVAKGGMAAIWTTPMSTDYFELRAGVEARSCARSGLVCGLAGLDLGGRYEKQITHSPSDTVDAKDSVLVPRVGFDLGGDHLRVRQMIEYAVAPFSGHSGFGLSLGVAYQF